ncbi:hypothetical protein [Neisseria yangbaofengii]|uniref:hypothetical protein n=1 Tax=Neisseria yangbaofengii TaxID=2709396 RepID=UPI0013EB5AEE|nr:hypothetical protein [Neisseria yangbaofengii]
MFLFYTLATDIVDKGMVMLGIFMLLLFGKLQDYFIESSSAWYWAAALAVLQVLMAGFGGATLFGTLFAAATLFVYAWAYFALLRYVADNLPLWLLILFLGALAPVFVSFMSLA